MLYSHDEFKFKLSTQSHVSSDKNYLRLDIAY